MTIHEIQDWNFAIATRNTIEHASVVCTAQMQISPLLNANFTNYSVDSLNSYRICIFIVTLELDFFMLMLHLVLISNSLKH